jgi:hypothetical protein
MGFILLRRDKQARIDSLGLLSQALEGMRSPPAPIAPPTDDKGEPDRAPKD